MKQCDRCVEAFRNMDAQELSEEAGRQGVGPAMQVARERLRELHEAENHEEPQ